MPLSRGTESKIAETAPAARFMTQKERKQHAYKPAFDKWIQTGKDCPMLLGKDDQSGEWLGVADDRHVVTVAGSRAGKSSTCLKPNLLLWPSSVLCLDPKGELAEHSADAREAMGQDVHVLDPFGEVKGKAARFRKSFNLLDELRESSLGDRIDDAAMLADSMIVPDKGGDTHWTSSAKNLLRGLILDGLHSDDNSSLKTVRDKLALPLTNDNDFQNSLLGTFALMQEAGDAYDGVISRIGATMDGKPENERGSIISTATEQTAFLDSSPMRAHLSERGMPSLRNLKRKPTTIYLVLPASRMATHFRWFRMILTLALAAMEREPMRLKAPVLFILEEFPQLGYMRQIEAAAGLMAGYDVKLWSVLQDLSQLKSQYPNSWETFLGNAGLIQAFGNTDATTTEYLSRRMGERVIQETKRQNPTASAAGMGTRAATETPRSVPLAAPFEISLAFNRENGLQLCLYAGEPPAYLKRLNHDEIGGMT